MIRARIPSYFQYFSSEFSLSHVIGVFHGSSTVPPFFTEVHIFLFFLFFSFALVAVLSNRTSLLLSRALSPHILLFNVTFLFHLKSAVRGLWDPLYHRYPLLIWVAHLSQVGRIPKVLQMFVVSHFLNATPVATLLSFKGHCVPCILVLTLADPSRSLSFSFCVF